MVEANPTHLGGVPRVPGTRIAIHMVIHAIQGGVAQEEMLRDYWPSIPADWLAASWADLKGSEPGDFGSPDREDYARMIDEWALDEAVKEAAKQYEVQPSTDGPVQGMRGYRVTKKEATPDAPR